jgi:hypothetical protein
MAVRMGFPEGTNNTLMKGIEKGKRRDGRIGGSEGLILNPIPNPRLLSESLN